LGVAPEARVLSLPLIPDGRAGLAARERAREGRNNPLARAIRYAADRGADVISFPFTAFGAHPGERQAVAYALRKGVVLVAAAGDYGDRVASQPSGTSYWSFPAGYSGVIGVAAVDDAGLAAPFSSDNLSVLVSAPGVDVPVALPDGRRGVDNGSTASAALVAGVAALIKAEYPKLPPEMVARALTAGVRARPAAGYDNKVGFGMVDAAAALAQAGRLGSHGPAVPVPGERHFGAGPLTAAPAPPGPDPLRLWVYAGAVLIGLVLFGAAVVIITRRAEQRRERRS
jgi:subtilisin family serine protease